ncbi:hypothetical protein GYMC52_3042 [Geobacillus sp. Y412MC52]|nr:hypothetical protein GYMC52_3042 [Geobacillus sp. Y412MC52]
MDGKEKRLGPLRASKKPGDRAKKDGRLPIVFP